MSVNLETNHDQIVTAWKDVLDDKSETNWALFGYEGQTNVLRVVGTGDAGLEELNDELNSAKIMYAFVRVEDPKTSLIKYVLINWQGEGAPVVRKGTCANHIRDVAKLLKGAHLTINARLEDEVEKDRILQKVSAVGSAYRFKDHKISTDDNNQQTKAPIGTIYSRVNPSKEINTVERDSFWKKEEEEEKKRIDLERERKKLDILKVEEERRSREQKEYVERERRGADELSVSTSDLNLNSPTHIIPKSPTTPTSPTFQPEISRGTTHAELMRQQRNQEVKEIIGSRVGTAKAIFSQNTASGQMQTTKSAPAKPVRNSIAQRINSLNNQTQQQPEHSEQISNQTDEEKPQIVQVAQIKEEVKEICSNNSSPTTAEHKFKSSSEIVQNNGEESVVSSSNDDENDDLNDDQFSTIKRSPHTKASNSQVGTPSDENIKLEKDQLNSNTVLSTSTIVAQTIGGNDNELITGEGIIFNDMLDIGLRARALYDYQAVDESEITFDPGDVITHIDQIDEGWWQGLGPDGSYGLFPANYVELIKD